MWGSYHRVLLHGVPGVPREGCPWSHFGIVRWVRTSWSLLGSGHECSLCVGVPATLLFYQLCCHVVSTEPLCSRFQKFLCLKNTNLQIEAVKAKNFLSCCMYIWWVFSLNLVCNWGCFSVLLSCMLISGSYRSYSTDMLQEKVLSPSPPALLSVH